MKLRNNRAINIICIFISMFLLVIAAIALYQTFVIPQVPIEMKRQMIESLREKSVRTLLVLIESDKQLLQCVERLESKGLNLNQAIASVVVKEELYTTPRPSFPGEVPLLKKDKLGKWMLVDVYGKPYKIIRRNKHFKLFIPDQNSIQHKEETSDKETPSSCEVHIYDQSGWVILCLLSLVGGGPHSDYRIEARHRAGGNEGYIFCWCVGFLIVGDYHNDN